MRPCGPRCASQRARRAAPPQADPCREPWVGELVLLGVGQVDELDSQQARGEQLGEQDPARAREVLGNRLDRRVHRVAPRTTGLGIKDDRLDPGERRLARVAALVDEHRLDDHLNAVEHDLQRARLA